MNKRVIIVILIISLASILGAYLYKTLAYDNSVSENLSATDTDYEYNFNIGDNTLGTVTIKQGEEKYVDAKAVNTLNGTIKYKLYYTLTSPSSMPSGVTISSVDTNYEGVVNKSGEVSLSIYLKNNSSSDVSITLGLKGDFPSATSISLETGKVAIEQQSSSQYLNAYLMNLILGNNSLPALSNGTQTSIETSATTLVIHHPATTQTKEVYSYRYSGASPNNYITFNGETWRVIGVEEVELAGGGTYEYLTKIIRNDSIGSYSWDNKNTSTGAETAYGKNDWTTARLMKTLNPGYDTNDEDDDGTYESNSLYWNKGSGICYSGANNAEVACDFTSSGMGSAAKSYIENIRWKIGGQNSSGKAHALYNVQNETTVYSGNPNYWDGKVGLMTSYDYGYAASRTCFASTSLRSYDDSCYTSDWLYKENHQWTISHYYDNDYGVGFVRDIGSFISYYNKGGASSTYSVRPVVYLKSSIVYTGGSGTSSAPFTISD